MPPTLTGDREENKPKLIRTTVIDRRYKANRGSSLEKVGSSNRGRKSEIGDQGSGASRESRKTDLELIEARFFFEDAFRFLEDGLCFFGGIANGRQAQASRAANGAEHVEDDTRLTDLAEVQTAPND
jgi:hypothetical protein